MLDLKKFNVLIQDDLIQLKNSAVTTNQVLDFAVTALVTNPSEFKTILKSIDIALSAYQDSTKSAYKTKISKVAKAFIDGVYTGHQHNTPIAQLYIDLLKKPPTPKSTEFTKLQKAIKSPDINTGAIKSANQLINLKKSLPAIQQDIDRIIKEYDNQQFALIFPELTTDNAPLVHQQILHYLKEFNIMNETLYLTLLTDIAALSSELDQAATPTPIATKEVA